LKKTDAELDAGDKVDLLYIINRNWFNGVESPQIIIKDICRNAVN